MTIYLLIEQTTTFDGGGYEIPLRKVNMVSRTYPSLNDLAIGVFNKKSYSKCNQYQQEIIERLHATKLVNNPGWKTYYILKVKENTYIPRDIYTTYE